MDDQFPEFTPGHLECLRHEWGKFERSNKLYMHNREVHTFYMRKRNDKSLMYVVNLNIPHYSDFAREVARERGLIQ